MSDDIPKIRDFLKHLGNTLMDNKVLLAITIIILLFLIFNHIEQMILFLVAVAVSVEVGILMYKFYQTDYYKKLNVNFTKQEELIITSSIAGVSGYMIGSFTRIALAQIESLFQQLAGMIYEREIGK
jgi:hypothetical protein